MIKIAAILTCTFLTCTFLPCAFPGLSLVGSAQAMPGEIPKLDIESTCRRSGSVTGPQQNGYKNCMADERAAQLELGKKWPTFKSGPQSVCTTSTSIGGAPSYVELITCLELDKQAAQASIENAKGLVVPTVRRGKRRTP